MLVFCARPSKRQAVAHLAGDLWRHAAIIAEVDGEPRVVGFGRNREIHNKPLSWLEKKYHRVGGRVGAAEIFERPTDAKAAGAWVFAHRDHPAVFPEASTYTGIFLSLARWFGRRPVLRPLLWAAVVVATCHAALLEVMGRWRPAFLCSTLVLRGARHAGGPQRLPEPLNLLVPKGDQSRPGRFARPVTALVERWMATPSDLWRAVPEAHRFEVDFTPAPTREG